MYRFIRILLAVALFVFSPVSLAEVVNINTATAEQLETLTGIGQAKAQAIVEDRDKNGQFQSIDDLARVKGIGAATIEKNRTNLTVGTGTTAATGKASTTPPPADE